MKLLCFLSGLCTSSVLERLLAFKALQPHYDLSLAVCSLRYQCLGLSHDDILLGEQKPQEAGDEEAVANSGGPANPIHLRLRIGTSSTSVFLRVP